jgi:hypothetical protein
VNDYDVTGVTTRAIPGILHRAARVPTIVEVHARDFVTKSKMNEYEILRQERITRNKRLLAELNIASVVPHTTKNKPLNKKRKLAVPNVPSRSSARIAAAPAKPVYSEDDRDRRATGRPKAASKQQAKTRQSNPADRNIEATVLLQDIDSIKRSWTDWTPQAPLPTRDEEQVFHFEDYPDFAPNKSPEEMLREGCFGGSYFRPLRSRRLGIIIENDWQELPNQWIADLNAETFLTNPEYNADVNKYKVACGQSIEEWEASGWIRHEYDVRGWFQWYSRFFQGRRCDDDERQVSRWKKCVGETGRWRRMLLKKYMQLGVREVFDDGANEDAPEVSPVMHQTCHHWAFEVRQEHLDKFWASGGR